MKGRSFIAGLLLALPAFCTVYYIDDRNGADSNPGRSSAAPWRTLARTQSAKLQAGDYILLRRGGAWKESLTIDVSGSIDTPIYFGAYGSGARPIIEGQSGTGDGLVRVTQAAYVNIAGWNVRNNIAHGVEVYVSNNVKIRDMEISGNRQHGVSIYNSDLVSIEDSVITANGADPAGRFAGVSIDGNGGDWAGFLIRGNTISRHESGEGWETCDGISLGHTGDNIPSIRGIRIVGNTIDRNGNPNQNQAGRGIKGSFHGDVEISGNTISNSASAGIYLGDYGLAMNIIIRNNLFLNNKLRQFGGTTTLTAVAEYNTVLVNDPSATAMGAEVGGTGRWTIQYNTFNYMTDTDDSYRGFIRVNDNSQQRNLRSDYNTFYSAGPRRWYSADDRLLDFREWQASGFDKNSVAPVPPPAN